MDVETYGRALITLLERATATPESRQEQGQEEET
jgi:hypothetical protein